MAFDYISPEIADLFRRMVNQPEDAHQLAEQLREKFRELRAEGLPIPDDLLALERQLEEDSGETPSRLVPLDSVEARGEPAEGDGEDPLLDSPGAPPL